MKILILLLLVPYSVYATNNCFKDNRVLKKDDFQENFLSFTNFSHRFRGKCRGHSIVTQKSFYLMEFDKGENPDNCSKKNMTLECKNLYYDKIADVFFKDAVVEIPGFKNLNEFTSHPYIKGIIKYHVSKISHKFKTLLTDTPFENDDNPSIAHYFEGLSRIEDFQKPYLAITGPQAGNHALIGYKSTIDENALIKVCVRDPNIVPNPEIDCENYLYLKKVNNERTFFNAEGVQEKEEWISTEVFYHRRHWEKDDQLYTLRIYREEDKRVDTYINSRFEYCSSKK